MRDETGESSYTYDIMNRLTSVTSADGKTISYAYDTCGRLGTLTYADGRTVSYAYDLDDRLTSVDVDGDTTTYDYDAIGRVVKTTRPDGSYTEYSYNSSGNLIELQNIGSDGSVFSAFAYTYDAQGYIVSETAKTETEEVTRSYTYRPSGELTKFTESDGAQTAHYTYSYDSHGNRTKLVKSSIAQPETIEYTYNAANQLISETSTIDGTTCYAYDDNGNLISKQGDSEKELTYEYTVEQRLKAVREGGELLMAASYDGDGNRVFQISRTEVEQVIQKDTPSDAENTPRKGDAANAGTAGNTPQSGADATPAPADDNTSLPHADTNAAQTTKTSWERDYVDPADSIFWYGFGQGVLQLFNTLNTALAADLSDWFCHAWDSVTGQYQLLLHSKAYSQDDYDAMRNAGLTEKDIAQIIGAPFAVAGSSMSDPADSNVSAAEKATPNGAQSEAKSQPISDTVVIPDDPNETTRIDYELTYYINDVNTEHTQVLMEYGKRDELKKVYTYGNERIAAETLVQAYSPNEDQYATDYYLYDGRGSVAQVLRGDEIVQSYSYDPFGNVTSGAPEFDSFYGYNAEDTNPVTGLQYLRARYYDSETGRFDVADTYLGDISAPLTLNRYSYAVNNPMMLNDPSGHWPNWVKKAANWVNNKVVKPVVNTAKNAANWVSEKVVKPVVNTVKRAADWVDDKVIQPITNALTPKPTSTRSSANTAAQKLSTTTQKTQQGYNAMITASAPRTYAQQKAYIQQRTAEIKQRVIKFSCGVAEKISKAWESVKGTVNDTSEKLWAISAGYGWKSVEELAASGERWANWKNLLAQSVVNRLSELPANPSEKEIEDTYTEEAGKLQEEFRTLYYGSGDWTLIKNTLRPLYEDYKDPNESEWNEIIFGGLRAGFEVGLTQSAVDAGMSGMGSKPNSVPISGLGAKSDKYVIKRGWTMDSINETYSNPYTTRYAFDKASGHKATAYYNRAGDYVVVDDVTHELLQLSKFGDTDWIPDSSILDPYKP